MLTTCSGCSQLYTPTKIGQRLCNMCLHLRQQKRKPQPPKVKRHRGRVYKKSHLNSYILVKDPGGDYNRGAIFSTREILPTLGARGFNPGTVLQRGNHTYTVTDRGDRLVQNID